MIIDYQIIVVPIPDERVRADGIGAPFVPQDLLLPTVVINTLERDPLLDVCSLIDRIHNIENLFVFLPSPGLEHAGSA